MIMVMMGMAMRAETGGIRARSETGTLIDGEKKRPGSKKGMGFEGNGNCFFAAQKTEAAVTDCNWEGFHVGAFV